MTAYSHSDPPEFPDEDQEQAEDRLGEGDDRPMRRGSGEVLVERLTAAKVDDEYTGPHPDPGPSGRPWDHGVPW